jgi:anhydro-N-acetylmuramic acid kinase
VLVDFAGDTPRLVAANTRPLPGQVRSEIRALSTPTDDEIERLGRLDVTLGRLIADAVNALLVEAGVVNREVTAIGSHGQTLRRRPQADPAISQA